MPTELATFGGGCFWCIEAVFEQLRGVSKVESGYAGGASATTNYREVCTGTTGHAEVIQVTFDPAVIPYRDLLQIFFGMHDPTTLNRQGADVGTQYRSAVFTHSPEQDKIAREVIAELNSQKLWEKPIVTEVTPISNYCPAEDYHQGYFRNNPEQGYCLAVIPPKLAKLRSKYGKWMQEQ